MVFCKALCICFFVCTELDFVLLLRDIFGTQSFIYLNLAGGNCTELCQGHLFRRIFQFRALILCFFNLICEIYGMAVTQSFICLYFSGGCF